MLSRYFKSLALRPRIGTQQNFHILDIIIHRRSKPTVGEIEIIDKRLREECKREADRQIANCRCCWAIAQPLPAGLRVFLLPTTPQLEYPGHAAAKAILGHWSNLKRDLPATRLSLLLSFAPCVITRHDQPPSFYPYHEPPCFERHRNHSPVETESVWIDNGIPEVFLVPPGESHEIARKLPAATSGSGRNSNKIDSVYISYAWDDSESDCDAAKKTSLVGEVIRVVEKFRIQVIRDTTHTEFGDQISMFERQLGAGHYIVVVLTESYLHSLHCMHELYLIFERAQRLKDRFLEHVIPVIHSELQIFNSIDRLRYRSYWKDAVTKRLDSFDVESSGSSSLHEVKVAQLIYLNIDDMLGFISDTLSPRKVDDIHKLSCRFGIDGSQCSY